jgi:four helix bundle protein
MRNFRNLEVWREAMNLTIIIYRITDGFPQIEEFGLKSQLRRAAVSIPSNIAEGCSRNTNRAFVHFLEIALGSSYELETQLLLSKELRFIKPDKFIEIKEPIDRLQRKLNVLRKVVNNQ